MTTQNSEDINPNIVTSPKELKQQMPSGLSIAGLDLGDKTIGIAISDISLMIATPYETIKRKSFDKDIGELIRIISDRDVGGIVIGLPVQMNGTEGSRAEKTRVFIKKLLKQITIPVLFWDERFSSVAIEKMLVKEADMSRKKRKKVIDKAAAAFFLQGALDAIAFGPIGFD
ncbi:MAG: Holliday junction resolvase RuvX [Alphaproteobacteria bacterium]|nr:Holliday junction resolvase RuvX [Alphaproteobacteria bacterium]